MKIAPLLFVALACDATNDDAQPTDTITHRADVRPVTRAEDALPGVFIPPFLDCRTDGSGEVCTWVSIAGATRPGRTFAEQADCAVVRTQRPYYPSPPAREPPESDPRLNDTALLAEWAWAKAELQATGCACCHDSVSGRVRASQWDISAGPLWLDSLSDEGLALFSGLADSSVLGAYPADQNHGFDRTRTGVPTTDTSRMQGLVFAELERRGISRERAASVPPFGGPIYENRIRPPTRCGPDAGIDSQGRVQFPFGEGRYFYLLEAGSENPGVPPNLDRPAGTLWRLDVLPNRPPLGGGFKYGATPPGAYQDTPANGAAPALVEGRTYQLTVLLDVGIPLTNCLFVYGETPQLPAVDAGQPADAGIATGLGRACVTSDGCEPSAPYCALQPGQSEGYCTITGCKEDETLCPTGYQCFDLSVFQPGGPSICTR